MKQGKRNSPTFQLNTRINQINMRILLLMITCAILSSCNKTQAPQINITGTWELISATTIQGDSTYHKDLTNTRMIKILNETHFSFLNHDLGQKKDSEKMFVAGGGTYKLEGDNYTESLDYCNYREWENNTFEFKLEIKGDTLIQNGLEKIEKLGVDRRIIEVFVKTKT